MLGGCRILGDGDFKVLETRKRFKKKDENERIGVKTKEPRAQPRQKKRNAIMKRQSVDTREARGGMPF